MLKFGFGFGSLAQNLRPNPNPLENVICMRISTFVEKSSCKKTVALCTKKLGERVPAKKYSAYMGDNVFVSHSTGYSFPNTNGVYVRDSISQNMKTVPVAKRDEVKSTGAEGRYEMKFSPV
uniref:Uncharacterized protein n=1 Tax=Romanomermis culicivorax TaxID=13658 RepID=A0A915J8D2_ROMCU